MGDKMQVINNDVCFVKEEVVRANDGLADVRELLGITATLRAQVQTLEAEVQRANSQRDQLEARIKRLSNLENKFSTMHEHNKVLEARIAEKDELIRLYRAIDSARWILEQERALKRPRPLSSDGGEQ